MKPLGSFLEFLLSNSSWLLPLCFVLSVMIVTFWTCLGKRKAKKVDAPRKKTFLEEALEADVEKPRPTKAYTWDEFQKDLHDGSLTFNEIYEKYGGVFPKKPEAPKEGETKAAEKKEEGPGAKSDDPDRMAQLQAWFKERGEERRLQGLVPPPPAPHTVIHKIYTRGRR